MKKGRSILISSLILLLICSVSFGGSIILPFWEDGYSESGPIYSMLIITNTSQSTNDQVKVRFYGQTGNPQESYPQEKTVKNNNVEIIGTGHYPEIWREMWDPLGYAIASETDGKLIAIGIVYNAGARAGYPIPCFPGNDNLEAVSGW